MGSSQSINLGPLKLTSKTVTQCDPVTGECKQVQKRGFGLSGGGKMTKQRRKVKGKMRTVRISPTGRKYVLLNRKKYFL